MKLLRPTLILTLTLLSAAGAQVNTEAIRRESASLGWSGSLGGDLGLLAGNSELLTVNSAMRLDHRSSWGHNFVAAQLGQGKSGDEEFSNKGFVHGRSVQAVSPRIFAEGFAQQEYDKSINLSNRQLLGGGARLKTFTSAPDTAKGRAFSLVNGFGLMWEHEVTKESDAADSTKVDLRLLRSTNYMVVTYIIDERLSLSATGYFQFDTRRPADDYRILFDASVNVNLTSKLMLSVVINLRYDSEPPAGVKEPLDVSITNGIAFSF